MSSPKDKDEPLQSVSEQAESPEPERGGRRASELPDTGGAQEPATTSTVTKRTNQHSHPAASASTSPRPSRDPSPTQSPIRPGLNSSGSRSRKNSQDLSPARTPGLPAHAAAAGSVPSAAAVQRALATTKRASVPPAVLSQQPNRPPKPQTSGAATPAGHPTHGTATATATATSTSTSTPKPPSLNTTRTSTGPNRKADSEPSTPSIVVQQPSTTKGGVGHKVVPAASGSEDQMAPGATRAPGRGSSGVTSKLETVQESSVPATPAVGTRPFELTEKSSDEDRPEKITENPVEEAGADKTKNVPESGSDSGGAKIDEKARRNSIATIQNNAAAKQNAEAPKTSYSALNLRGKAGGDVATQKMTVETETVSSIPQVAVGGGAGERGGAGRADAGGSLRLKPSTETIRPKKERKKASRKAPSLNSGTASSKADIFEAKIASAVDEADSSDSEETFVYESNPPEPPHTSRPSRFHSRTPSATSTRSQTDHRGGARVNVLEGNHSITGKKSMKFTNNPYNSAFDGDAGAGAEMSTVARSGARGGGPNTHHHHIGHWGRSGRGTHMSLLDGDAPFPPGKQLRSAQGNSSRLSSKPSSPRTPHHLRPGGVHGKKLGQINSYEIDVEGADDERTPLVGTANARNRHSGPGNGESFRQLNFEHYRQRGWMGRFFGCLITLIVVILVVAITMGFLFATTKPLLGVHVNSIENVLASEQEIMLDLVVEAMNPNAISVTVSDMDVNVFAKSKHVGTDKFWRSQPRKGEVHLRGHRRMSKAADEETESSSTYEVSDRYHDAGKDEGTDPIPDPEGDSQTMLLGRIFEFDSALNFDSSPIKRQISTSIGEVRLAHPGNKTEAGGSDRWEGVLEHPFELIIRGVLKYQLPLSSRARTASIGASVIVHPEDGVDQEGRMNIDRRRQHRYSPGSNMPIHKSPLRLPDAKFIN
ncbi:MAG: hypothetical protein M1837_003738 [Sclerophora amabilis]|nr:MAG: hypothetical protein M1837_003738 [Sclerophora amabilis]